MFNIDKNTRRPAVAGSFYPKDPNILRKTVQNAGYVYSAHVAAPAYKLLSRIDFDTVVIIGHDFGRNAPDIVAVLDDHEYFETPLGRQNRRRHGAWRSHAQTPAVHHRP